MKHPFPLVPAHRPKGRLRLCAAVLFVLQMMAVVLMPSFQAQARVDLRQAALMPPSFMLDDMWQLNRTAAQAQTAFTSAQRTAVAAATRTEAQAEPDLMRNIPEAGRRDTEAAKSIRSQFEYAAESLSAREAGDLIGLDLLRQRVAGTTGSAIVAVLDTGTDTSQPSFVGRITDPWDAVDRDVVPQDLIHHGTHVAGIIADNTPTGVRIMPIRIFPDEEGTPDSLIVAGIHRAVSRGADIINLSLGGPGITNSLRKAVAYARDAGVLVVVSAGNGAKDVSNEYPAALPEVLTVGATGRDGDLLYYSNTGAAIDLCAPGEKILSADPDGGVTSQSGTSMAAPLVSAAAALLKLEDPTRTPAQLEALLMAHTVDLGAPGRDDVFGAGSLSFRGYAPEAGFYVVGGEANGRQPLEELAAVGETAAAMEALPEYKFDLSLRVHAGETVRTLVVRVDGTARQTYAAGMGGVVTGRVQALVHDIRDVADGPHRLDVEALDATGQTVARWSQAFVVPAYNVRIRAYDLENLPPAVQDMRLRAFSDAGRSLSQVNVAGTVIGGVWCANVDFQALSGGADTVLRVAEFGLSGAAPVYLRTLGRGGDKVLEPSESELIELQADPAVMEVRADVMITAVDMEEAVYESAEPWGNGPSVLNTVPVTRVLPLLPVDGDSSDFHTGYLCLDTAGFWVELSSGAGEGPAETPSRWWGAGYASELDGRVDLDVSAVASMKLEIGQGQWALDITKIPEGRTFGGPVPMEMDAVTLPEGVYAYSADWSEPLTDGRRLVLRQKGTAALAAGEEIFIASHPALLDVVRPDDAGTALIHRWITAAGADFRAFALNGGLRPKDDAEALLPELVLTQVQTGLVRTVKGKVPADASRLEAAYSLTGIPDGTWRTEFRNASSEVPVQTASPPGQVTLQAGKVVVAGNTNPVKASDYYTWLSPGGLLSYPLAPEFTDAEQDELEYHASAGYVEDGWFHYRDMTGESFDITLTAYDMAGGSTFLVQEIRITDEEEMEPDYRPIADIDSIGASSWAVDTVKAAITTGLVPAALADQYQNTLSRLEFCRLVMQMVERRIGVQAVPAGTTFTDTHDPAVRKAAALGIVQGVGGGKFQPAGTLTREQLGVMFRNAAEVMNPGLAPEGEPPVFMDAGSVSGWAVTAVDFCAGLGILRGTGGKLMTPKGTVTREQGILMAYRLYALVR